MMSTSEPRKAGVASPSDLKQFVSTAGSSLLVVDVRHPDPTVEPGDVKSLTVAGFPNKENNYRPAAINLAWSRESNSMEIPSGVEKDTPIITHCGGGGRGQKAKDYLEGMGFTKVLNGGGPKETECWAEYGDK
jgi:rhodanese-related sulfurtransferase